MSDSVPRQRQGWGGGAGRDIPRKESDDTQIVAEILKEAGAPRQTASVKEAVERTLPLSPRKRLVGTKVGRLHHKEDHLMERQMQQRTFKKHPQSHEESVAEAEASLDTQAIMGKDKTRIAALAYELYEQRGREDGHQLDDWLEAEQRIVSRGQVRGF
jgi:predicted DsbA family dithiol-disulfide isomerase